MENEVINLVSQIAIEENCQNIYEKLIPIFADAEMYEEQTQIIGNLYNLTNNPEYLEQIGDIQKNGLKDNSKAQETYYKYLSITNPTFFKKLKDVSNIDVQMPSYTVLDKNLLFIIDRYATVTYLMTYFHNKNMLTELFETSNYTDSLIEIIEKYVQEYKNIEIKPFQTIRKYNQQLSNNLSKNCEHKEVNELAIKYNKENEKAYLNILDILVAEEKYNEILEFYNEKYIKAFVNMQQAQKPSDIIWFLSDKYYANNDYYNSLLRKKIAINIELGE